MFMDEAVVEFRSGKGGSGAVAFYREKFVAHGGPIGSDGGKGGDVVLVADRNKRTLYDFKLNPKFEAPSGEHAVGNKKGRDGKGIIVKVPVGTVVIDAETDVPIVDLNQDGMKFILCKGGKGGFGNLHYTNSIRQAPNFAQKGAPAQHIVAKLELKLLADIAIVGLPNAGKSTLISRISAARPKIADYPFTTLVPNLGVVKHHDDTFVVADMPGLIKGASEGVGLGHQFLKHVERCRAIVHLVECSPLDESDPVANYELIETELKNYSQAIYDRPRLIVISKIDMTAKDVVEKLKKKLAKFNHPVLEISSATDHNISKLIDAMADLVKNAPEVITTPVASPAFERGYDTHWEVEETEEGYNVLGDRIQRLVEMTDLENKEAIRYMHKRLERLGVIKQLREMGAEEGDSVFIGDFEFSFTDEM
ncbi:MAG: GTPase ObgE [Armatimonadetes bacterium]|nr:GTPase ObgE [Armatimonadota bacterium]